MTEKNKIVIPTKSLTLHTKLKDELLTEFTQIPAVKSPSITHLTPSKTTLIINSIARAGYFRPKSKGAEVNFQPHKVYPNYMKRDPREYPPIHCCAWRPKSTTGEVDVIQSVLPRTKHVHHTLFDAGKYVNVKESPTVKSVNKTVFGKTITTPLNLLSSESFQFDTLKAEKFVLNTEGNEHNGEDILRESGMTSFSKIISPESSTGFNEKTEFRKTFKGDPAKLERCRERYEATQSDFKKIQLRIDELARRKRGWYQENMNESVAVKEMMGEGSVLLKGMDSSHHREQMRHAVRLSKVHSHYEKNWKRMGPVSNEKTGNEDSMRVSHSRLRTLVNENQRELSKVFNTTNSGKKEDKILG